MALGDAAVPSAATLAAVDVLIIDDRGWVDMGGGGRGAIAAAVRGGMGLVVRITEPVPRGWQALGLVVSAGAATTAVVLAAPAISDEALSARRGVGTRDRPIAAAGPRDAVPLLTRQAVAIGGARAVPLIRDAKGTVLAAWQASGRGRVAAISLHDSFALVTSGHGDLHAELWSALVSAVARPRDGAVATIDPLPRAGERVSVCGAGQAAAVMAPGGPATRLLVDPVTPGCAGYWPNRAGWHRLTGPAARAFFVHPADSLPGVRAANARSAPRRVTSADRRGPGSPDGLWRWRCCGGWSGR
jgi:hypothetical protein